MCFIHRLLQVIVLATPAGATPASFAFPLACGETHARQALDLLGKAAEHGLDPKRYGRAGLARRLDAARDGAATAALERDLGAAILRDLAELHAGSSASANRAAGNAGGFDIQAHLERALLEGSLEQTVDEAAPGNPLYRSVMASLAQYRDLARRHPDWPAPAGRKGRRCARRSVCWRPGAARTPPTAWRPRRRRPCRHETLHGGAGGGRQALPGTPWPGRGRRTRAARPLASPAVPPAERAAQLALPLERLHSLPPLPLGRTTAVNLPAYRSWAFDSADAVAPVRFEMRIIVGTAAHTPTPLFIGEMRYLELNPYGNVPRSIAIGEILPFTKPNLMNIDLHSTSSTELFDQTHRDLSHGCMWVEQPVALAEFVLAHPQTWNAGVIEAAIADGRIRTVALPAAVPVVLFYGTAVTGRDGRTLSVEDIYQRDAALIKALGF